MTIKVRYQLRRSSGLQLPGRLTSARDQSGTDRVLRAMFACWPTPEVWRGALIALVDLIRPPKEEPLPARRFEGSHASGFRAMSAISAAAGFVAYFQKGSRLIGYTLPGSGCPARRCGAAMVRLLLPIEVRVERTMG